MDAKTKATTPKTENMPLKMRSSKFDSSTRPVSVFTWDMGMSGSMRVTSSRTRAVTSSGAPAVRSMMENPPLGCWAMCTNMPSGGAAAKSSAGDIWKSRTTPTTVCQGFSDVDRPRRSCLPIGSSPGQFLATNRSSTITTSPTPKTSVARKPRPATTGTPMRSKNDAETRVYPPNGYSESSV